MTLSEFRAAILAGKLPRRYLCEDAEELYQEWLFCDKKVDKPQLWGYWCGTLCVLWRWEEEKAKFIQGFGYKK